MISFSHFALFATTGIVVIVIRCISNTELEKFAERLQSSAPEVADRLRHEGRSRKFIPDRTSGFMRYLWRKEYRFLDDRELIALGNHTRTRLVMQAVLAILFVVAFSLLFSRYK